MLEHGGFRKQQMSGDEVGGDQQQKDVEDMLENGIWQQLVRGRENQQQVS